MAITAALHAYLKKKPKDRPRIVKERARQYFYLCGVISGSHDEHCYIYILNMSVSSCCIVLLRGCISIDALFVNFIYLLQWF